MYVLVVPANVKDTFLRSSLLLLFLLLIDIV
jgi:hypothetical protein